MRLFTSVALAAAMVGASACQVDVDNGAETNQAAAEQSQGQVDPQTGEDPRAQARARELAATFGDETRRAQMRDQARREMEGLRIVVDQSDRKVRIYQGDKLLRTHDVAVGTDDNPTPTGEFAFNRVDLNPRWVPPDSEWAEDRETQEPGAPDNPMGRARLVYKMPYTIHGTDDLNSLGKAVSHGSIRLANENVIPLAEMMLKSGNAWQGPDWFRKMVETRDEEYQIPLEQEIPLKIQE